MRHAVRDNRVEWVRLVAVVVPFGCKSCRENRGPRANGRRLGLATSRDCAPLQAHVLRRILHRVERQRAVEHERAHFPALQRAREGVQLRRVEVLHSKKMYFASPAKRVSLGGG